MNVFASVHPDEFGDVAMPYVTAPDEVAPMDATAGGFAICSRTRSSRRATTRQEPDMIFCSQMYELLQHKLGAIAAHVGVQELLVGSRIDSPVCASATSRR